MKVFVSTYSDEGALHYNNVKREPYYEGDIMYIETIDTLTMIDMNDVKRITIQFENDLEKATQLLQEKKEN